MFGGDGAKRSVMIITTKKKIIEERHFFIYVLGQINGAPVISVKVLKKLVAIKGAEISDCD